MWNYLTEDLTSIVYVEEKNNTLVIKIFGIQDIVAAEMFAHYAMAKLEFDLPFS
jgi:hypothetical protein